LFGSAALREGLEGGQVTADLAAQWEDEVDAFNNLRNKFLLY
jgi:uncharacterized protein YbbC (DUF1343 family)